MKLINSNARQGRHLKLMSGGASGYATYLGSAHWATLKEAVHRRCSMRCEACDRTDCRIVVHHVHYGEAGDWSDVTQDDLAGLCQSCHRIAHRSSVLAELAELPRDTRRCHLIARIACIKAKNYRKTHDFEQKRHILPIGNLCLPGGRQKLPT